MSVLSDPEQIEQWLTSLSRKRALTDVESRLLERSIRTQEKARQQRQRERGW